MSKYIITVILLTVPILGIANLYASHPLSPIPIYTTDTVHVDSLIRSFNYYAPNNVTGHPGLIFAIHGSGATGEEMQFTTGRIFDKLADKKGDMIIVYPNGYHKFWNDCRSAATYDAKMKHIDDIAFFRAMIRFFGKKYHIDYKRIFATGMSNGGQMCLKLAMEEPETFKGIAPIAASMPVETNNDCHQSGKPVSMLFMCGTADPYNPYNGGEVKVGDGYLRGSVYSVDETMAYWLKVDGCKPAVRDTFVYPHLYKSDNSEAINYTYRNKSSHKEVVLIKVVNGGHIFPNPGFVLWPKALGNVNYDINGPKIVYDFFEGLK